MDLLNTFLINVKEHIAQETVALMNALPDAKSLSGQERRSLIARYTAVLEGNFIAWMTAAHIAARSDLAQEITKDNLREEIEGNHPGMLHGFTIAAASLPSAEDYAAVRDGVEDIRTFNSALSGMGILVMMAFFENFIATFMPYLADLAKRQGSTEFEYTNVHGGLDVEHTEGLLRAIRAEAEATPGSESFSSGILEGVDKLSKLIRTIIKPA